MIFFENFKLIGLMMILYLISYIINTLLGIYNNTNLLKEMFDRNKLIDGSIKAGIILIASTFFTFSISTLPILINELGIEISQEALDGISITSICIIMVTSILKYLKDALQKFYNIIIFNDNKDSTNKETNT